MAPVVDTSLIAPRYELDEDMFVWWLEENEQKQVPRVGFGRSECDCPIANFIKNLTGTPAVTVTNPTLFLNGRLYYLPMWAVAFINYIDRTYGCGSIRPEAALQFFHQWNNSVHGEHLEPDGSSGSNGDA